MVRVDIDDAIFVQNLDAIMDKLKKMDPKLARKFKRELRNAVKPVQNKAKSFVPNKPFEGWRETKPFYPTNWGWAYDTDHRGRTFGKTGESRWQWSKEQAISGIVITTAPKKVQREGFGFSVTALALQNKSVPGVIYELAGFGTAKSKGKTRRVSRNKNASEGFIRKVGKSDKPRLIYKAAYEMAAQVHANLYGVLKKYLGENFRG